MGVHGVPLLAECLLELVPILSAQIPLLTVQEIDLPEMLLSDVFIDLFHVTRSSLKSLQFFIHSYCALSIAKLSSTN